MGDCLCPREKSDRVTMTSSAGNPGPINKAAGWMEPVRMRGNFEDEMMLTCPRGSGPARKIRDYVHGYGQEVIVTRLNVLLWKS